MIRIELIAADEMKLLKAVFFTALLALPEALCNDASSTVEAVSCRSISLLFNFFLFSLNIFSNIE